MQLRKNGNFRCTNWCFWTVVLEKTLESPMDSKEIKPVHPKGNQPWIFIGKTDTEAEAPILWPPDVKSWLIGKDPHAGKDWGQEEKGTTEDKMIGWHHRLNGHEFEQTLGDSEGQGSLTCCSLWGRKELDTTEWLNNNYIVIWHLHITWNDHHSKSSNNLSTKLLQYYWPYSLCCVLHPMTYNWMFVPLNPLHLFCPPSPFW